MSIPQRTGKFPDWLTAPPGAETPETPETPEIPETPETSETPETPETPEIPETPETSETPETPETLETPETPGALAAPEAPATPETPAAPETPAPPGDPGTLGDPAIVAAARRRAAELVQDPEVAQADREGLQHLQNHVLSMGLAATRVFFRQMVTAARLRGEKRDAALREIDAISPITDLGCMEVKFYDRVSGKANVAYMYLNRCPKNHDLGAQLEKLKSRCATDKWPEVLRHLSMLVHLGRTVYSSVAESKKVFLQSLAGSRSDEFRTLKVDLSNTTLYLDGAWPRVGIFVKLETPR